MLLLILPRRFNNKVSATLHPYCAITQFISVNWRRSSLDKIRFAHINRITLWTFRVTKLSVSFPLHINIFPELYRDADKSSARPGRKQANVSVTMPCISFGALPLWLGGGGDLMAARVSLLLKSRPSLTCFWDCFLPGRAKDLSAPWVCDLLTLAPSVSCYSC